MSIQQLCLEAAVRDFTKRRYCSRKRIAGKRMATEKESKQLDESARFARFLFIGQRIRFPRTLRTSWTAFYLRGSVARRTLDGPSITDQLTPGVRGAPAAGVVLVVSRDRYSLGEQRQCVVQCNDRALSGRSIPGHMRMQIPIRFFPSSLSRSVRFNQRKLLSVRHC